MAFPYSVHKTYISGEILTASDLNSTDVNHVNNQIPESTDDYSANVAEMQSTADPYPASSESLPTSLSGEIERLRYQVKAMLGETHWYYDTDTSFATIAGAIGTSSTEIQAKTGNAAGPSITFSGDTDTGFYLHSDSPGTIGFTVDGTSRFRLADSYAIFDVNITAADGSAANPGLSFTADTDSGLYRIGTDNLGMALGGSKVFDFKETGFGLPDGAVGTPSLFFNSDTDTGFYYIGAANIGLSLGNSKEFDFSTNGLQVPSGTAATPGMAFSSSSNTGMYLHSTSPAALRIVTDGTYRVSIADASTIFAKPVFVPDGASGTAFPSIGFSTQTDTGIYKPGVNQLRIKANGVDSMNFADSAVRSMQKFYTVDGSAAGPSVTFWGDGNSGMFSQAADNVGIAAGGIEAIRIEDPADLTSTQTSLWLYDDDNGSLEQVTVGAADSGGSGYKVLRIPN